MIAFVPMIKRRAYFHAALRENENGRATHCAFPRSPIKDRRNKRAGYAARLAGAISVFLLRPPLFPELARSHPGVATKRGVEGRLGIETDLERDFEY